jgi:hypothetical protein
VILMIRILFARDHRIRGRINSFWTPYRTLPLHKSIFLAVWTKARKSI